MPDLGNISLSSSLTHCPTLKSVNDSSDSAAPPLYSNSVSTLPTAASSDSRLSFPIALNGDGCNGPGINRYKGTGPVDRAKKASANGKDLEDHVRDWVEKKMELGVPKSRCFLPFLVGAPKMVECLVCNDVIYPGEELLCSVRDCRGVYHSRCVMEKLGISTIQRKFKCPQHACFICKQRLHWRCVRCTVASHGKCAPWPEEVIHLKDLPGQAICWRHPTDWRLDKKAG